MAGDLSSEIIVFKGRLFEPRVMPALVQSSCAYTYHQYDPARAEQPTLLHTALPTPAVDEATLAGSGLRLSLSAVASRSSGKASAHRMAALPYWRGAGGDGLTLPLGAA